MAEQDAFSAFYDTQLKPVLDQYEKRRRGIVSKFTTTSVITAVLGAGGALAAMQTPPLLIVIAIVALGIIAFSWWLLTHAYKREFKSEVVGAVVRFCNPELQYQPEMSITRTQFEASQLFKQRIDRYKGEDQVVGTVGQTRVEFSEVHAEYKTESTDSKGRRQTHWHTIFKGVFFIADFNKHFKGCTVVLPDTAEKLFGFRGKKLQSMNFTRGELINLEDPDFERAFVVYGDDQVEARYILSTSLMRRILGLKERIKGRIFISFVNSCLNLAMETRKNMFEPRLFRKVDDFEGVKEYRDDLEMLLGIVEELNLNNRIWTKE